jgi:glyoxylase-like metal-dependent hydrolase (beta-lactamase superfamily II)
MEEIGEGLWCWSAAHPDWTEEADWPQRVQAFAHRDEDGSLVLIDPLVEGGDWSALDDLAARHDGVRAVLVSVHWHQRDAAAAAERFGAELYAPSLAKPEPRESLRAATPLEDGTDAGGGIRALVVPEAEEALLWLAAARTLIAGDVLLARQGRLSVCPDSWLDDTGNGPAARRSLRRALGLPLEAVVVSHGDPALFEGREPLEAALRE